MLKWSIMKPVHGWQEDDVSMSNSPTPPTTTAITLNILQQLINDTNNSLIPCLVKVKSLMTKMSTTNPTSSSSSMQSQSTSSDTNSHHNYVESIRNDDIWLILEKYYSSCVFATCLDSDSNSNCKKFAIPLEFDGIFT
jgi:hypothetical protein